MGRKGEVLTGELSGEAFLLDFKVASQTVKPIDKLESWILAGSARYEALEEIKIDPLAADERLAVDGLASLLSSIPEQVQVQEILEELRQLELNRFLGYRATVHLLKPRTRAIYSASTAVSRNTGTLYLGPQRSRRRDVSGKLTSISPYYVRFRINEYRSALRLNAFREIRPFDDETGEPVVDIQFQGPRKDLPPLDYRMYWAANRF